MDESLVPLKLMANAVEHNFQVIAIKLFQRNSAQSSLCRLDLALSRDDICLCGTKAAEHIRNASVSCHLV